MAPPAASITIYMALAAEFILRFLWKRPVRAADGAGSVYAFDRNTKLMLAGLTLSSLCIYVRSVRCGLWYERAAC